MSIVSVFIDDRGQFNSKLEWFYLFWSRSRSRQCWAYHDSFQLFASQGSHSTLASVLKWLIWCWELIIKQARSMTLIVLHISHASLLLAWRSSYLHIIHGLKNTPWFLFIVSRKLLGYVECVYVTVNSTLNQLTRIFQERNATILTSLEHDVNMTFISCFILGNSCSVIG